MLIKGDPDCSLDYVSIENKLLDDFKVILLQTEDREFPASRLWRDSELVLLDPGHS